MQSHIPDGAADVLPFFSGAATTGSRANPLGEVNSVGKSKKIFVTQTGWPSNQNVWKANAASAVASTSSEKQYFDLLDNMCGTFKKGPHGGTGWFAHSECWRSSALLSTD